MRDGAFLKATDEVGGQVTHDELTGRHAIDDSILARSCALR